MQRPSIINDDLADLLADYRRAKAEVNELRGRMMRVAVEDFGLDQVEVKSMSLDAFFDGYLIGQGVMQKWRKSA